MRLGDRWGQAREGLSGGPLGSGGTACGSSSPDLRAFQPQPCLPGAILTLGTFGWHGFLCFWRASSGLEEALLLLDLLH